MTAADERTEPLSPPAPPLVSVLMPAFNAGPFVAAAIRSILSQTHSDLELLVADDLSSDQTREVVASLPDPRIRILHNDRHLGYLRTTNRLFELARGRYVTFQDADDLSEPIRLAEQVRAFQQEPGLGACGTWAQLIDARGGLLRVDEKPVAPAEIRREMYVRNPFCGATMMVRMEALRAIGGYREGFEGLSHQDYDWACRLVERYAARNLPRPLYAYRQHGASNSKQISVGRAIGHLVVRALAEERRQRGSDCLADGDSEAFAALVARLGAPYVADPARLDREFAARFLWAGFPGWAIRRAWSALRKSPWHLRNYRLLVHCVRRLVLPTRPSA